eukprot:scaffold78628_cov18-Tisochrysis_lutea.AAC.1
MQNPRQEKRVMKVLPRSLEGRSFPPVLELKLSLLRIICGARAMHGDMSVQRLLSACGARFTVLLRSRSRAALPLHTSKHFQECVSC